LEFDGILISLLAIDIHYLLPILKKEKAVLQSLFFAFFCTLHVEIKQVFLYIKSLIKYPITNPLATIWQIKIVLTSLPILKSGSTDQKL